MRRSARTEERPRRGDRGDSGRRASGHLRAGGLRRAGTHERDLSAYVDMLAQHGDRVALARRTFIAIERETFTELVARTNRASRYLASQGVQRGDRVLVCARNAPEWVELLFATVRLGAVLVPVDVTVGAAAAAAAASATRPNLAFCDEDTEPWLEAQAPTRRLSALRPLAAHEPDVAPTADLDGSMPAVIIFTSGTTADPKGVVLTHANLMANIEGIRRRVAVSPRWRLLSVLPLSHAYELTGSLAALAGGAQIVYLPQVTPALLARALQEFGITTILAIPELLSRMLARIRQQAREAGRAAAFERSLRVAGVLPRRLRRVLFHSVHRRLGGRLELVITGGAPIPVDVARAWERMGVRAVQGYGLTETSPILTVNGLHRRRLDSPGRPLDNVELRIAADGEIQARGPSVFPGYFERDDATRDAFTDDGWFRTGDVGRLRHGWLTIEGRLKFAVVRASGLKVFPEDVEVAAASEPALGELCVVGVGGPTDESVLAVVRSTAPDGAITAAVSALNERLPEFQHVDAWRRWPEPTFPRTRLGKVDRRRVREWALGSAAAGVASTAAPGSEDRVGRIVRESLDDPATPFDDSSRLADIGLGSLGRLSVVASLEEQLGVTIPEQLVAPATTVGELRAFVERAPSAPPTPVRPRWPYWRPVRALGTVLREGVIDAIVRLWVRIDVVGTEELEGLATPALFIFNHSDDFDGPVVWRALPARIRRRLAAATADDVLRSHRVLAALIRLCFAGFSFARSEPLLDSFEYVGELVDRGWNVAIAPEGRVSTDGRLHEFKSGVGVLAVNLGVPVVPVKTVGLAGTVPLHARWPRKHSHATVRIGTPLRFAPDDDYREVAETLHGTMEAM